MAMSLPSDYASILNDLNRDVIRHRPLDPLQFCADWFQHRLREDRRLFTATSTGKASFAPAGTVPPAAPAASSSRDGAGFTALRDTAMPFANSNPFGAPPSVSVEAPSRSNSIDGSEGVDVSGDVTPSGFTPPSNFNMARRTSVSAESLAPASPVSSPSSREGKTKTVIPKTDSQLQRIRASIQNNLLFRNLDEEQERDVLMAMKEVQCETNSIVIKLRR